MIRFQVTEGHMHFQDQIAFCALHSFLVGVQTKLQSAAKWVETLCPKWVVFRFYWLQKEEIWLFLPHPLDAMRGVKGLLCDTWLSVFNFCERWKYEIKTRELWLVCLLWYVNFKSPDIRDFQLIFSWNSLNWRQILQGSQWTFKWTFLKGLKKLKGRLFKWSLASGWQNRVLSHFQCFQRFILTPVMVKVSWHQQGRLGSYTLPYDTMYTIFPWPI